MLHLQGTTRLTFKIATRGLLGLKNALLTATRGLGLLNTLFDSYRCGGLAGNLQETCRTLVGRCCGLRGAFIKYNCFRLVAYLEIRKISNNKHSCSW
jgi:GTP-binding protein